MSCSISVVLPLPDQPAKPNIAPCRPTSRVAYAMRGLPQRPPARRWTMCAVADHRATPSQATRRAASARSSMRVRPAGELAHIGQRGRRERERRGARNQRRHVGNGVVHDAASRRMSDRTAWSSAMSRRCRPGRCPTSTIAEPGRIAATMRAGNQLRRQACRARARRRSRDRPPRRASAKRPSRSIGEAERRDAEPLGRQRRRERVAAAAAPRENTRDAGTQARGDARGFAADVAGADDHDGGARNIVDAGSSTPAPPRSVAERLRAHERRKAARRCATSARAAARRPARRARSRNAITLNPRAPVRQRAAPGSRLSWAKPKIVVPATRWRNSAGCNSFTLTTSSHDHTAIRTRRRSPHRPPRYAASENPTAAPAPLPRPRRAHRRRARARPPA